MIDAGNMETWPSEVVEALERFKQGDLVGKPPFFYAGVSRYAVWSVQGDGEEDLDDEAEVVIQLDPADGPAYGMIVTQTCDLNEQAKRRKQPWIQVVPVYPLDNADESRRHQIKTHQINYLVALDGPKLPPGFWVADLRIQVPLEKSWLVGREPIEAFADEGGYLTLAKRLAGRAERPALSNDVSNHIVVPLRERFKRLSRGRRPSIIDPVLELRLAITGSRLKPTAARLLVITKHEQVPQEVQQWFDGWWRDTQPNASAAGIDLIFNWYVTLTKLPAQDYVNSVPLHFDYLSPDD